MSAPAAPPVPASRRVGLREVARTAGVCLRTASLSVQNSPKISAATRQRVCAAAAQLGYTSDAEISRLMGRLRSSRATAPRVVIAMVDPIARSDADLHPYDVSLRRGIATRADALGFGVILLRLGDHGGNIARLTQAARAQNIAGLLLLPPDRPISLNPRAGWENFCVVAATTSITAPRFHQVVPNQFYNMMTLLAALHVRGRRHVGAILSETLDRRTAHFYSLALTWHGHRERILVLPNSATVAANRRRVAAWARTHRPDAILFAQDAEPFAPLLRAPVARGADVGPDLISLSAHTRESFDHLDQLPELIGASAVSILAGMMHHHETGVPAHPQVTAIDGIFRSKKNAVPRPA